MDITYTLEKLINHYFALFPRKKPKDCSNAKIIAHRGVHDNINLIENTHASFEEAVSMGLWGIEFDVHTTKDNVLVVNHDPDLNRLWHVDKKISHLEFDELQTLAPNVPKFSDVVERYSDKLHFFIELKEQNIQPQLLLRDLQALVPCDDYHLLSLKEETFKNIELFPKHSLLLVPEMVNVKQFCQTSLDNHYGGVLGSYLLMTKKLINELLAQQQVVGVGFVDSKNSLYRELNRGIEWIFTNKAKEIMPHFKKLK